MPLPAVVTALPFLVESETDRGAITPVETRKGQWPLESSSSMYKLQGLTRPNVGKPLMTTLGEQPDEMKKRRLGLSKLIDKMQINCYYLRINTLRVYFFLLYAAP